MKPVQPWDRTIFQCTHNTLYMTGIPRFQAYEDELRDRYGDPNQNIFTVSGLSGTGTTTIANLLADMFDLERISAGDFFRKKAREFGMDIQEFDEKTPQLEAEQGTDFDLEWDRTALEYAFTRDRFVLDGRLAGALLRDIAPIRVKVVCDPDVVAERITSRERLTVAEAKDHVAVRNQEVLQRYKDKYDIDPRTDRFYNVHIDNSQELETVKQSLLDQVNQLLHEQQHPLLKD